MSRRGENIWHRKDGRWEARYVKRYDGNRAVYGYLYARSYADVKAKQKAAQQGKLEKRRSDNKTFESLTEAFLCQKKHNVKESTLANYRFKIRRYLMPYWKSIDLDCINTIFINRFVDTLFSDNHLAPKTVKDITSLLASIIEFGCENQMIRTTPKITVPKVPKGNISVLTQTDQKYLYQFLMRDTDYGKLGVTIALMTGMRIGEICALKKSALDFENSIVTVCSTLQRISNTNSGTGATKLVLSTPKSDSSMRCIPLSKSFALWLEKQCSRLHDDDFIITGTHKLCEPRTYYKKYVCYLNECGLGNKGYTFHTLRHTFATEAIRNGMNAKSLSEILGHSSVKITLEKYVHPSFEQKKQEIEQLMLCHPLQYCLQSVKIE